MKSITNVQVNLNQQTLMLKLLPHHHHPIISNHRVENLQVMEVLSLLQLVKFQEKMELELPPPVLYLSLPQLVKFLEKMEPELPPPVLYLSLPQLINTQERMVLVLLKDLL